MSSRKIHTYKKIGWILLPFLLLAVLLIALLIRFQSTAVFSDSSFGKAPLTTFSSSSSSSSSLPSSTESSESVCAPVPTLVPESEPVPDVYFQETVFVGDSITEGLRLYGVPALLPAENVVAYTGINPDTIRYSPVLVSAYGESCTFLEKLIEMRPKRIYYMNGTNGVGWLDNETLVELNRDFLLDVKEALPDCQIYIQSIFPFTASLCAADPTYDNDLVREYNSMMYQLAQELDVYFINCYEALADENGNLPEEASNEGIHFGPTYYEKWAEYLYTHTVLDSEEREELEKQQATWEKEGNSIPIQDYSSESSYPSQSSRPQTPSNSSEDSWESSQEEQETWPPKDTWPPEDGRDDEFSSDTEYKENPEGTL